MKKPPTPDGEAERLESLRKLGILDTPAEERYDRITRIAKKSLNTKIAIVSLVDSDRQWFKSVQGLNTAETSRNISFCGHAILDEGTFVIPDAKRDPRFADNPLVTDFPAIRMYAGQPIHSPDGQRVGTLCVIDSEPRDLDSDDLSLLEDLAMLVENELRTEALGESAVKLRQQLTDAEQRASLDSLTRIWNRESIIRILDLEINRAGRARKNIGVAMIDIDHFKKINDEHGHVKGDEVLAAAAERIRGALRPYDSVGRYGGEEFLAVIVEPGNKTAGLVGERIRQSIACMKNDSQNGKLVITTSVGICTHPADSKLKSKELILAADKALYLAKQNGRNRVEICHNGVV